MRGRQGTSGRSNSRTGETNPLADDGRRFQAVFTGNPVCLSRFMDADTPLHRFHRKRGVSHRRPRPLSQNGICALSHHLPYFTGNAVCVRWVKHGACEENSTSSGVISEHRRAAVPIDSTCTGPATTVPYPCDRAVPLLQSRTTKTTLSARDSRKPFPGRGPFERR